MAPTSVLQEALSVIQQNAQITINFRNDTDVDSTLHSHGIRMENKFDGVPDVTQEAVKPGESFTYKLKFPDVGIYWYHPHIREDYAQELGLYGNFLVTPSKGDYWAEVDREETLFLDDILIQNGQIAAFSQATVDHTLMGRFGNVMLVNGDDNCPKDILKLVKGKVIINFTERYRNTMIDYNFLKHYAPDLIFAGTEREHWLFCNQWGLGSVPRLVVKDFLELAYAIKNCRFLLGNQSMNWNLAEAMKTPRLLEI
jgi:hypothetical protein